MCDIPVRSFLFASKLQHNDSWVMCLDTVNGRSVISLTLKCSSTMNGKIKYFNEAPSSYVIMARFLIENMSEETSEFVSNFYRTVSVYTIRFFVSQTSYCVGLRHTDFFIAHKKLNERSDLLSDQQFGGNDPIFTLIFPPR